MSQDRRVSDHSPWVRVLSGVLFFGAYSGLGDGSSAGIYLGIYMKQ